MRRYCETVPGPKLANMLEGGQTPWLSPSVLEEIGYSMVAYPVTLLLAGIPAMTGALAALREGEMSEPRATFAELQEIVGFPEYRERETAFADEGPGES